MTTLLDLIEPPADLPVDERKLPLEERFPLWLARNGPLVQAAVELARRDVKAGRRCSMKRYFELIRANVPVDNGGPTEYRLDNSYAAPLARHVMETYPELDGKFELRGKP